MAIVRHERKPLTGEQIARLSAVADTPDERIDFSDVPDSSDESLLAATRGHFYRPIKKQTTLRLDADVLDWFRRQVPKGKGYQTEINRVLRDYVEAQRRNVG